MKHVIAEADELLTVDDIYELAREHFPREVFDYASGGAGTETTMRRNREALDAIEFRPTLLQNVEHRSTSTSFLGVQLSVPLMFAPVGSIAIFDEGGATTVAAAARERGIASFVPTIARPSLEDVARDAGTSVFFQLYVRGDRDWLDDLVGRVESAGYAGIAVTVDHDIDARRERDIRNRFSRTSLHGTSPNLGAGSEQWVHAARFSWQDFDWLRRRTSLPLMLKGVTTGADAVRSLDHGADAVYVSNHGGRALDHLPPAVEVLDEVCRAVQKRAPILVDGGILHGSDIAKALALGADAVLVGKLQCWALGLAGQAGLERVVDLLTLELKIAMGLLGVRDVSELGREHLWRTPQDQARCIG